MEKIKEIIWNDLELYFYLYRDKEKWDLAIEPTYLHRASTDRMSFQDILEEFCMDNHIEIYDREIDKHGAMIFYIKPLEFAYG